MSDARPGSDRKSNALAIGLLAEALADYCASNPFASVMELEAGGGSDAVAEQQLLAAWIRGHRQSLPSTGDFPAFIHRNWLRLNGQLEELGFEPPFTSLGPNGLGCLLNYVAELEWSSSVPADIVRIEDGQSVTYSAFRLPQASFVRERLNAFPFTERVSIRLSDELTLYVAMVPEKETVVGASLLWLALLLVNAVGEEVKTPGGLVLPQLYVRGIDDLTWLEGLRLGSRPASGRLSQLWQYVDFSLNPDMVGGNAARRQGPDPLLMALALNGTLTLVLYSVPEDGWERIS